MANILEIVQSNDMIKVALILLGVYILYKYTSKPSKKFEQMDNYYGLYPEEFEQLENVEDDEEDDEEDVEGFQDEEEDVEGFQDEEEDVEGFQDEEYDYEGFQDEEYDYEGLENVQGLAQPQLQQQNQGLVVANAQQAQIDKVVAGADQVKADDLLPKYNAENEFAKENPVSKLLKEQNFLISGYHVGINTVMQSNKIPYHDIRSLPPIPKENAGPWNQSSYEQGPAQMRRFFEIGV
jgi:hypothetical protein